MDLVTSPDYVPPESAEELLRRYADGHDPDGRTIRST